MEHLTPKRYDPEIPEETPRGGWIIPILIGVVFVLLFYFLGGS